MNMFEHRRSGWIYLNGHYIPYPFKKNIQFLSTKEFYLVFRGLIRAHFRQNRSNNLFDWIINNFGETMANFFYYLIIVKFGSTI